MPVLRSLHDVPAILDAVASVGTVLQRQKRDTPLAFAGVWGGIRGLLAATLTRHTPHVLVLLPQAVDADVVAGDVRSFGISDVVALPLSAGDGTGSSIRDADYAARLQVLQSLRARDQDSTEPLVVTAYIGAAIQKVPSRDRLTRATRRLTVGDEVDPEVIRKWLAEAGFAATTAVQVPGEFASRGGLLDIHSPDQTTPIRIEWFGDEIESIRRFDPATQRSNETITSVEIAAIGADGPAGMLVIPEDEFDPDAMPPEVTPPNPDQVYTEDTIGAETTVVDYLPEDTVILLVDPAECQATSEALLRRVARTERFVTMPELLAGLHSHQVVTGSLLASGNEDDVVDLQTAGADSFAASLDETKARVDSVAAGHEVIVVGDTPADGQRLTELLADTDAARSGRLHMTVADLSGGFRLSQAEVLVLTGAELFHRSPVRRASTRVRGKPIDSFLQLTPGDLVVHLSHGIGLYRGLNTIEKGGQHQEHLTIEFDGGTKIHVPATRIQLIQRYVGGTKTRPKLAKIGGISWTNQRKAAESAVVDMADELLELQAKRATKRGIAFDPDNEWQRQFDASFPYLETPDQLTAIDAVKADMESHRPMDRLICGDVGFGKTEVAMRAAFKAVTAGYQVAVLVPTTVLAEQHYHSFCNRMAEFPVEIRKLSRFCTATEQRETVKEIRRGKVDIVIGTHRVASKDVDFNNLGLVIIDEEQRFGVAVKERLKTKHTNVDVLTLSATPIPRTLHMALVGARDISNLETPPAERMAVETKVTRWDPKMIRSAIVRELNRGGQMYFVHNRIGDMVDLAAKIQEVVPEIRIGIGHGQMGEGELEQIMIDFIDHKFDMLLATTIIESGLDIPNANTMFIDDGNRYGLSDLHQLRGRVGRYKHQAYCYLLVSPTKHLTPEASKRLRAIEEYSQMGAGFAISMRDLEIRGAGNLLGSQQSGHIAAVGYEMYCQLLEDAVRQAQKLPPKLSAEVDIDLPIEAYLPDDYVPDLRHKIDLYRRMTRIDQASQIAGYREELIDRFGPLPDAAKRMIELCELRLDAAAWGIASITNNDRFIVLEYSNRRRIEQLVKNASVPVRIVDHRKAYIPIKDFDMTHPSGQAWLQLARAALWIG
ncbi:transcription-repair coupling factor [Neorhodopirellula pilleata]|uniref:Transcription-repair-coupling factor n=1 Tax=Neorhodopirellula pilleata TaxID=2714738 RepID=A0A5C5ZZ10_9BACT|nr:transcription-repair coupling factor [Neorhodopirellula pilleata]TWT92301.1 Transcription-repair-coupling factor [Neorhodopirellula pilleata]